MNNPTGHFIESPKIALAVITSAWLVMQVVAWYHFGIKTGVDTALYVADAGAVINGEWTTIGSPLHLAYSILLAVVIVLTGEFINVVIVQLVLSLLAVLSLYRLTFAFSGTRFAAFVAALLFVAWPDVSQWNFVVYTDSVFMNMVIVSITILHFSKRPWHYVLATLLIGFTMFIRPVGVVFFLSLMVYLFGKSKTVYEKSLPRQRRGNPLDGTAMPFLIGVSFIILGLIIVNFALHHSIDYFLSSYIKTEIIYPDVNLGIHAPPDLWLPNTDHQPVTRLFLFILNNPIYFLKLFFIKVVLFVGHVKPYFSVAHNLLIGIFLYPLYVLAVPGVRSLSATPLRNFALTFIVFQVLMVGLTSENWDGRFLLPVLPWVFILSSVGIFRILKSRFPWNPN